jgi:hypothetical protein
MNLARRQGQNLPFLPKTDMSKEVKSRDEKYSKLKVTGRAQTAIEFSGTMSVPMATHLNSQQTSDTP